MIQETAMVVIDVIDGEVENAMPTLGHGLIASRLQRMLGSYVEEHDLGYVFSAQTFFRIGNETRDADVAYVVKERLAALPPDLDLDADFAPDLAVEIASRSDTLATISRKVTSYLDSGVQAVWIVNPWLRTIEIYRPDGQVVALTTADVLDADPVVPGLSVALANLFPPRTGRPVEPV